MPLRKAFTLILCAVLTFYIFSGPALLKQMKEDYKKSQEPVHEKTEWTGVITLWDYPHLDIRSGTRFSWIKSKIKQFEKQNPGIYFEFRELDLNEGPGFIKAAAKIGANPDIAPVGSDYFFVSGGYLEELDEHISFEDKADFIDSILETTVYNGKIYGIPWMMTGYTMLLNTDMLSERNVSLPEDGEWTYEQFVEALKQLTYDGVYGFNSFIEPGYYNTFGIIMCDGAQIIDDATGRYIFNTPEAVSGLAKLCDLKHKYKVTHPDFGVMNDNQAWATFLNGKVAVCIGGSWTVPLLRNIQGKNEINFTTIGFPTGKSDIPLSLSSTLRSYSVFKQKDAAKRQVCIDFIKFITSGEAQKDLESFGYFPVRKSGKHLYENDKEMYTIQQNLYFAEHIPKVKNWNEIDLILQTGIKEAVQGNKSPEQAVKEAERLIEQLRR